MLVSEPTQVYVSFGMFLCSFSNWRKDAKMKTTEMLYFVYSRVFFALETTTGLSVVRLFHGEV